MATSTKGDDVCGPQPARLITPPLPAAAETLPARINSATRQVHASLNKLVTSRLLYGLPPHSPDPTLYLHGIDAFAQLYFTLEDAWQDLICEHLAVSSPAPLAPTPDPHEHAVHSLLSTLVSPQLWRTARLDRDIFHLASLTACQDSPLTRGDDLLDELLDHIQQTVKSKPHVLFAYSWVLYMAIFSGGRWIRARLQSAGPDFWGHESREGQGGTVQETGMSLFYFDGIDDGEDVKRVFKEKFAGADLLLSETEKVDVVWEAGWIFEACTRLVRRLDEKLATTTIPIIANDDHPPELPQQQQQPIAPASDSSEVKVPSDEIPQSMRPYLPPQASQDPKLPGRYVTAGLDAFTTVVAVVLGVAGWYFLYTHGLVGRGFLSDLASLEI